MGKAQKWTLTSYAAIEAWRVAENLTKKGAARRLGVTGSTYQNWANGVTAPPPNTQRRIAEVLSRAQKATSDGAATATGEIVAAYLASGKPVSARDLPKLIRSVRQAVQG